MIVDHETLKDFLKIPDATTSQDDFLDTCCEWAQGQIESWLKRAVESTAYSETRDGDGSSLLYLKNYPIVSVTSITINDVAVTDLSTNVKTNLNTGAVYLKSGIFTSGFQNVTVVYTAGYAASAIPDEIKAAVIELAAIIYKDSTQGSGRLGIQSEAVSEAGSNTFMHGLNPMTLAGLKRHKRIAV